MIDPMEILKVITGEDRYSNVDRIARNLGFQMENFKVSKQGAISGSSFTHYNYTLRPKHIETLILAHYDRVKNSPGANDNGAAVAAMLKASEQWTPESNTMLALVDLEEPCQFGMAIGSQKLKEQLKADNIKPKHIIVLDMCGIGDCFAISTRGSFVYGNGTKNDGCEDARQSWFATSAKIADNATVKQQTLLQMQMPPSDDISFPGSVLVISATEAQGNCQECWRWIHSPRDAFETVQPEAVDITSRFITTFFMRNIEELKKAEQEGREARKHGKGPLSNPYAFYPTLNQEDLVDAWDKGFGIDMYTGKTLPITEDFFNPRNSS